jgi:hypothetical protein
VKKFFVRAQTLMMKNRLSNRVYTKKTDINFYKNFFVVNKKILSERKRRSLLNFKYGFVIIRQKQKSSYKIFLAYHSGFRHISFMSQRIRRIFMNEKLQYASMLEIPVNTVNVTLKPSKKRRRKSKALDDEKVKQELIEKVNSETVESLEQSSDYYSEEPSNETLGENFVEENFEQSETVTVKPMTKQKKKSRFSVIAVQFAAIGALVATIFLTSALNANSGINVFFRNVFSEDNTQTVDAREFSDFAPVINLNTEQYVLEDGVMTLNAVGSVYSPCNGTITDVTLDGNGRYTV